MRSDYSRFFAQPSVRTKQYGDRRFDVSAAVLRNGLPADLRQEQHLCGFKKSLKTHLFKLAFYD